jgi:hypothetical protein
MGIGNDDPGDNLTERQKKWFASVQASLERDTGKTLAEWVAIARTCPETSPKARSVWLREHHGLGANRGAQVLYAAFPPEMGWDDAPALRAALWKDPASTAIFEAVEARVKALPKLVTGQRKGFSAWSREFQFAAVKPTKGGTALLGLAVTADASPRLTQANGREGWSERLKSKIALSSPDEVDDDIAALLKQAWERS